MSKMDNDKLNRLKEDMLKQMESAIGALLTPEEKFAVMDMWEGYDEDFEGPEVEYWCKVMVDDFRVWTRDYLERIKG